MKGIIFFVLWISCTALHTFYDVKIKPILKEKSKEWGEYI